MRDFRGYVTAFLLLWMFLFLFILFFDDSVSRKAGYRPKFFFWIRIAAKHKHRWRNVYSELFFILFFEDIFLCDFLVEQSRTEGCNIFCVLSTQMTLTCDIYIDGQGNENKIVYLLNDMKCCSHMANRQRMCSILLGAGRMNLLPYLLCLLFLIFASFCSHAK